MSKKEEKVNQIIDAATEEFLQKGIDAASMQSIAENAEVSKRTLYKYYPTKEILFNSLVDEILDGVEGMYQFEYSSGVLVKDQIESVVSKKIELTLTDSFIRISKIILGELLKGRSPTPEQMKRLNDSESQFINWIRKAQKDKKISLEHEAEDIASQFHSILKGQIYWPVLMNLCDKKNINKEKVKKITVDFFLNSFCK